LTFHVIYLTLVFEIKTSQYLDTDISNNGCKRMIELYFI